MMGVVNEFLNNLPSQNRANSHFQSHNSISSLHGKHMQINYKQVVHIHSIICFKCLSLSLRSIHLHKAQLMHTCEVLAVIQAHL
mgnify:CR=1 FL=1